MTATTDEHLVTQMTAGSRDALAGVFDRYGGEILEFCAHVLGDDAVAGDATVETFVLAGQRAATLWDRTRLRGWLHAIAWTRCRARLRAARDRTLDEAGLERAAVHLQRRHKLDSTALADFLGLELAEAADLGERVRPVVEARPPTAGPARSAQAPSGLRSQFLSAWDRADIHPDAVAVSGWKPSGFPLPRHRSRPRWVLVAASVAAVVVVAVVGSTMTRPSGTDDPVFEPAATATIAPNSDTTDRILTSTSRPAGEADRPSRSTTSRTSTTPDPTTTTVAGARSSSPMTEPVDEDPPVLAATVEPDAIWQRGGFLCRDRPEAATVEVSVDDDSEVDEVLFRWKGPVGRKEVAATDEPYSATIGPYPFDALSVVTGVTTIEVEIVAVDAAGNRADETVRISLHSAVDCVD